MYESRHVKALATSLLLFVLVSLSARLALAHPDTLGEPDPYWQQQTGAASTAAAPDGAPSSQQPAAVARLLRGFAYASGGLFLLFLFSFVRSIRGPQRRSRA